jgi:hypothetical protein
VWPESPRQLLMTPVVEDADRIAGNVFANSRVCVEP